VFTRTPQSTHSHPIYDQLLAYYRLRIFA
jgi:hypothetical protein